MSNTRTWYLVHVSSQQRTTEVKISGYHASAQLHPRIPHMTSPRGHPTATTHSGHSQTKVADNVSPLGVFRNPILSVPDHQQNIRRQKRSNQSNDSIVFDNSLPWRYRLRPAFIRNTRGSKSNTFAHEPTHQLQF